MRKPTPNHTTKAMMMTKRVTNHQREASSSGSAVVVVVVVGQLVYSVYEARTLLPSVAAAVSAQLPVDSVDPVTVARERRLVVHVQLSEDCKQETQSV